MSKNNKKSTKDNSIILFNQKKVRRHWDEEKEFWYFSVVDVVAVLSESIDSQSYWRKLKQRLNIEKSQTVTKCHGLKMRAKDGRMRLTDVADTQTILRLVQSIPSPKAEPFKIWLAKVGYQRIEEMEDPELAFDRAMQTYLKKGYSKDWINQRIKSIEVRKLLTDEWDNRGVKGSQHGILTNDITKAWSGQSIKNYKKLKGLKKQNLRDNMSNLELVLNMLAEVSTTEISKEKEPIGLSQNRKVAVQGGTVAKKARLEIEKQTGKSIVSGKNKVLVTGVFDILHKEHMVFLKKAKTLGNYLVVGLESDVRVKQMKGEERPINSQTKRKENLEKLSIADEVFILPEKFNKPKYHKKLIKKIKPKFLAVSSHTKHLDKKQAILSEFGGKVVVVHNHNPEISTSKLL